MCVAPGLATKDAVPPAGVEGEGPKRRACAAQI